MAGSAVTGWRSRERLAAPVAETRDVTFSRSRSHRPRPDEPLFRNHRQDHRRAGGRPRAVGPTLGDVGGQGADRHAEERGDPAPLLRHQCPHSLGGRHRTGVRRPELANISPGLEPWRQRAQRRTRHHRRLRRPLHPRRGTQAGGARRRRSPGRSRSSSDLPCSTPISARAFPARSGRPPRRLCPRV